MKSLPSNLYQYKSLSDFRFVYNNLLDISQENYDFIKSMNRKYLIDQYYNIVQEEAHNKEDKNDFIEIEFPQIINFMSKKSADNNNLGIKDLIFRLYSTKDDYESRQFMTSFGQLKDDDLDGIYDTSDGLLKYNIAENKLYISNKFFNDSQEEKDDFRVTVKMYDNLFNGSIYSYDFTTVREVPYDTEYVINVDLAESEENIIQEGKVGSKNSKGIVEKSINEVVEYGPKVIYFDTIIVENPNLEIGKEKVIVEGVNGIVDRENKTVTTKVDKVVERGTAIKSTNRKSTNSENDSIIMKSIAFNKAIQKTIETTEDVESSSHIKYIQGYPDDSVRPDSKITRAEAATMIARLLNLNLTNTNAPEFKDTTSNTSWYNKYVNAVTAKGLMQGYPNGDFYPGKYITRAEFTNMIKTIDKNNSSIAPFEDVKNHWAKESINQAYGNERIKGYLNGSFKPNQSITRAETAKILDNLFNRHVRQMGLDKIEHGHIHLFNDLSESHWGYYEMVEASNSHDYIHHKGEIDEDWNSVTEKNWGDVYKK